MCHSLQIFNSFKTEKSMYSSVFIFTSASLEMVKLQHKCKSRYLSLIEVWKSVFTMVEFRLRFNKPYPSPMYGTSNIFLWISLNTYVSMFHTDHSHYYFDNLGVVPEHLPAQYLHNRGIQVSMPRRDTSGFYCWDRGLQDIYSHTQIMV